jgi:molybdopterin converting factor subunit 1
MTAEGKTVEVQLFAAARDQAGAARLELPVSGPLTVAQLRAKLVEQLPEIGPLVQRCRLAVDQQYVGDDFLVHPGSEIALIPPVSGG